MLWSLDSSWLYGICCISCILWDNRTCMHMLAIQAILPQLWSIKVQVHLLCRTCVLLYQYIIIKKYWNTCNAPGSRKLWYFWPRQSSLQVYKVSVLRLQDLLNASHSTKEYPENDRLLKLTLFGHNHDISIEVAANILFKVILLADVF